MMSDHEFVVRFISLYRSLPELWDRNCEEYPSRTARAAAYQQLIHFYRTKYPKAIRETIVKKINSLRVNFRREYNKVEWSKKTGGPVYEPRLYYYEELLFLVGQQDEESSGYCDKHDMDIEIEEPGDDVQFFGESGGYKTVWLPDSKSSTTQIPARPTTSSSGGPTPPLADNSEEMILARAYALKLTKMAPDQRIFADKLIHDVLMEGQLGGLSRASRVVTRSPTALCALPSVQVESPGSGEDVD